MVAANTDSFGRGCGWAHLSNIGMNTYIGHNPGKSTANQYASLGSLVDCGKASPLRVCIVTPDLLGPVKNGGIGTACAYLANSLAGVGHDVNILFSQVELENNSDDWIKDYEKRGIKVQIAAKLANPREIRTFPNHPPLVMAKIVYDWLAAQKEFDLVLFMEWQGCGFYALHARAAGYRFENTVMAVVVHSPSIWHNINNASFPDNPVESITWHIERKCLEMCDASVAPSAYIFDWCNKYHFKLPKLVYVQPNILEAHHDESEHKDEPISEIVFFGRLEYRKGLEQFCAAIDLLAKEGKEPARITFLGKALWMGDEHSLVYIARRSKEWKSRISFRLNCDHSRALDYLHGSGRLAVMPSVSDNSPYTVYECLVEKIPFLAKNVGGVAELIAHDDLEKVLFSDNPADFAQKIAACIGKKPMLANLAFDLAENNRAWQRGLPALVNLVRQDRDRPLITVCLTHYNRPALLRQALDSLLTQSWQDFELLLADDGSPGEETKTLLDELVPIFAERGWKIFRLENGYVGRARNILAKKARGQWLLFFDDDNIAMPDMLEKCAKVARSMKRGFVSLMFNVFEGTGEPGVDNRKESFYPVGDILSYSAINNVISDATCLIHRQTFGQSGGFSEDYGIGHEDFELLLRLVIAGEPAGIIPEPVFWYRRSASNNSMILNTNEFANRMRSLRPFMESLPGGEGEMAIMLTAMTVPHAKVKAAKDDILADLPHPSDGKDPQSEEVLLDIAEFLASENRQDLAKQLIGMLEETASSLSARAAIISAKVIQAADEGKIKKIREFLRDFHALKPDNAQRVEFYFKLLEHLREDAVNLRQEILQKLQAILPESIRDELRFASESLKANNEKNATDYFFRALDLAEKAYFEHRPDVAEAVRNGDFICALHHYALHGNADKMFWPEKNVFDDVLKKNGRLVPHALETASKTLQIQ